MKLEDAVRLLEGGHKNYLIAINHDGSRTIFFATEGGYGGGTLIGIYSKSQDPDTWSVFGRRMVMGSYPVKGYLGGRFIASGVSQDVMIRESQIMEHEEASEAEIRLGSAALDSYRKSKRKLQENYIDRMTNKNYFQSKSAEIINSSDLPSDLQSGLKAYFTDAYESDDHVDKIMETLIKIRRQATYFIADHQDAKDAEAES